MAKFSMQDQTSQHKIYEQKYRTSRMNLLLVVVFTAINLFLLAINADLYFLFSAFIPYFITSIGMFICGRFPEEYYVDGLEEMIFLDNSVFVIMLVISLVLTLLYLLAWFMSNKQRVGWIIFALVFFGIDTLGMLFINGISVEAIFDILFHAWVIYYLILGIRAHYKLKNLPPEEEAEVSCEDTPEEIDGEEESPELVDEVISDSPVIRKADKNVKHKILLEKHIFNYDICYRRVKHTNELVINGNVYEELEGVIEFAHTLNARIDGHQIAVGYNGTHSFISFDGDIIARKLRLI